MPTPIIAAVAGFAAAIQARAIAIAQFASVAAVVGPMIKDAIEVVMSSDTVAEIITDGVNAAVAEALSPHGLELVFSDLSDKDAIKSDLYEFAVSVISEKIGADFDGVDWETVEKDEIYRRLMVPVIERINQEAGAQLDPERGWGPDELRENIADEAARQFADGSADGFFSQQAIQRVESAIFQRSQEFKGIREVSQLREAVMNRKRQARWRKKSKQVWVTK